MDKTFRRTLRVKLLIVIVLGLVIAILTFFGGMFLLDRYVSSVYMSSDHTSRRSAKQIQSFASYVTAHSLKSTDSRALRSWQEQHGDVYIMIYNNKLGDDLRELYGNVGEILGRIRDGTLEADIYGAESIKAEAVTEKWSDLGW